MTDPLVSKEHARIVGFRLVTFLCSYNVTGRNNNCIAGSDASCLPPLDCEDPVLTVHLILTSV